MPSKDRNPNRRYSDDVQRRLHADTGGLQGGYVESYKNGEATIRLTNGGRLRHSTPFAIGSVPVGGQVNPSIGAIPAHDFVPTVPIGVVPQAVQAVASAVSEGEFLTLRVLYEYQLSGARSAEVAGDGRATPQVAISKTRSLSSGYRFDSTGETESDWRLDFSDSDGMQSILGTGVVIDQLAKTPNFRLPAIGYGFFASTEAISFPDPSTYLPVNEVNDTYGFYDNRSTDSTRAPWSPTLNNEEGSFNGSSFWNFSGRNADNLTNAFGSWSGTQKYDISASYSWTNTGPPGTGQTTEVTNLTYFATLDFTTPMNSPYLEGGIYSDGSGGSSTIDSEVNVTADGQDGTLATLLISDSHSATINWSCPIRVGPGRSINQTNAQAVSGTRTRAAPTLLGSNNYYNPSPLRVVTGNNYIWFTFESTADSSVFYAQAEGVDIVGAVTEILRPISGTFSGFINVNGIDYGGYPGSLTDAQDQRVTYFIDESFSPPRLNVYKVIGPSSTQEDELTAGTGIEVDVIKSVYEVQGGGYVFLEGETIPGRISGYALPSGFISYNTRAIQVVSETLS